MVVVVAVVMATAAVLVLMLVLDQDPAPSVLNRTERMKSGETELGLVSLICCAPG